MAEPHAHSQPIQTYGPAPHNRNIWSHNSRATAAPSRLADSFVCFSSCSLPTTHVVPIQLLLSKTFFIHFKMRARNMCSLPAKTAIHHRFGTAHKDSTSRSRGGGGPRRCDSL